MSQSPCPFTDEAAAKEGLVAWFTRCHRVCDDLWAEVESAVDRGDPSEILSTAVQFVNTTRKHLKAEEEVLFPMVGQATGMGAHGPVAVMLMEHQQMKHLLTMVEENARGGSGDLVLDHGDTLLMLTQQHNIKEEQILYPMSEQFLSGQWPEIHRLLEI